MADAAETVPLIVSAPKPFEAFRILTVFAAPLIVTVLEDAVKTEPAPDVSQFPATVQVPEAVIVPEVPPVIVTLVTLAAAVGLNCTLLNSETPKLAKVIVRDKPELKTTVPVPADHDPLVVEFVQEPPKFQVVAPKLKYPAAAMLTFPVNVFVPAAPPVIPPAMLAARVATVRVKVPLARTEPALTVSVPDTSTRPVWVTVPADEMTRLLKLLGAFRIAMLATPLIVTVLVPFVNTEPAPLVSQLPVLVNELVVSVIVPLVPPVIATLDTVTLDAFAVRMPPLTTLSAPPVRPRLDVASAVVEEPSEIVSVPPQIRALVAMVNVWADAAEEVNETLLSSIPGRFAPANVIVPPVALVNVTVPVPALHEADVEAFVQVPVTVQVDEPMTT